MAEEMKVTESKETPVAPKVATPVSAQAREAPRENRAPREGRGRYDRRDEAAAAYEGKESKPIYVAKRNIIQGHKIFNKWDINEVVVSDMSLTRYINLDTVIVPHSFGRKSQGRFAKGNINVVERLINKMMRSGQGKRKLSGKYIRGRGGCGKKLQTLQIAERAFDIVAQKTKKNPIQVLVTAVENAAPREDITRIKRGGVAYSLAVDVSPIRRLDDAIKNIALAAFGGSFNKKVSAEEALAEEIISCAAGDQKSLAMKRKEEVERIAKASR
jgi:small subunit ribosomal protein S7